MTLPNQVTTWLWDEQLNGYVNFLGMTALVTPDGYLVEWITRGIIGTQPVENLTGKKTKCLLADMMEEMAMTYLATQERDTRGD